MKTAATQGSDATGVDPAARCAGDAAPPDALALFAGFHARVARCCDALDALVASGPSVPFGSRGIESGPVAEPAAGAARPTALVGGDSAALVEFFEVELPRHDRHEDELLLPALIESMAGSDAVCLRELAAALADEHRALGLAWHRARAALLAPSPAPRSSDPCGDNAAAAATATATAAPAVGAFTAALRRHLAHEDDELLPMAARLITDDELARIATQMRC